MRDPDLTGLLWTITLAVSSAAAGFLYANGGRVGAAGAAAVALFSFAAVRYVGRRHG